MIILLITIYEFMIWYLGFPGKIKSQSVPVVHTHMTYGMETGGGRKSDLTGLL